MLLTEKNHIKCTCNIPRRLRNCRVLSLQVLVCMRLGSSTCLLSYLQCLPVCFLHHIQISTKLMVLAMYYLCIQAVQLARLFQNLSCYYIARLHAKSYVHFYILHECVWRSCKLNPRALDVAFIGLIDTIFNLVYFCMPDTTQSNFLLN